MPRFSVRLSRDRHNCHVQFNVRSLPWIVSGLASGLFEMTQVEASGAGFGTASGSENSVAISMLVCTCLGSNSYSGCFLSIEPARLAQGAIAYLVGSIVKDSVLSV